MIDEFMRMDSGRLQSQTIIITYGNFVRHSMQRKNVLHDDFKE